MVIKSATQCPDCLSTGDSVPKQCCLSLCTHFVDKEYPEVISVTCDCGDIAKIPVLLSVTDASKLRKQKSCPHSRGTATLPELLDFSADGDSNEKHVFSRVGVPVRCVFGPLTAPPRTIGQKYTTSRSLNPHMRHLDLQSDRCNWMKFVRCAAQDEQPNILSFQLDQQVFFVVVKSIHPGEDLIVQAEYPVAESSTPLKYSKKLRKPTIVKRAVDKEKSTRKKRPHSGTEHVTQNVRRNVRVLLVPAKCAVQEEKVGTAAAAAASSNTAAVVQVAAKIKDPETVEMCEECRVVVKSNGNLREHITKMHPQLLQQSHPPVHRAAPAVVVAPATSPARPKRKKKKTVLSSQSPVRRTSAVVTVPPSKTARRAKRKKVLGYPFLEGQCFVCMQLFSSTLELPDHELTHLNAAGLFHCPECGTEFPTRKLFKLHRELRHLPPAYTCDACGKKYANTGVLRDHQKQVHFVDLVRCSLCPEEFKKFYLREHMRRAHGSDARATVANTRRRPPENYEGSLYKCRLCRMAFTLRGALVTHMQIRHPDISLCSIQELQLPVRKYRGFRCRDQLCKNVSIFVTKDTAEEHLRKRHPECASVDLDDEEQTTMARSETQVHYCEICNVPFQRARVFLAHAKSAHPEYFAVLMPIDDGYMDAQVEARTPKRFR